MASHRRRPIALKIFVASIVGVAVLVLSTILWIQSVADRKWKELKQLAATLEGKARAREVERPVLRGTSVPGYAWDDYRLAMERTTLLPGRYAVEAYANDTPPVERNVVVEALRSRPDVLEHLARGARKTIGAKQYDWANAPSISAPDFHQSQDLVFFVGAQVRVLLEKGDSSRAIDVFLDGCQFIRDYADNAPLLPALSATSFSFILLRPVHKALSSNALSRADLKRLELALTLLDTHHPPIGAAYFNHTLQVVYSTLNDPDLELRGPLDIPLLTRARYGFSKRLLLADRVFRHHRIFTTLAANASLPWAGILRRTDEIEEEFQSSPNPLLSSPLHNLGYELAHVRGHLARLRILRAATTYRLTGAIPELPDPFGTTLKHRAAKGVLRIWSIGHNGKGKDPEQGAPEEIELAIELEVKDR